MTGVSTEMNFDDVSVKVEMVDEEYDCNGSLQPNSSAMAEIKTEPLELNESYGVLTEPQVPTNSNPGILLGNPVISSPPIMNRAQLDNYTMNAADVPTKKQIAALVKVAAPSTACTTIKQEVDRACHRLSQEGEQSLFLSVNVEKKLCSYVGSDMGRQFLSKRPDIMEHFFQFCQGQSGRSEIAEDISNNLTKPTIADFSQHEMPAPPCWNPTTPLKNLTPPRWILEPSNQKVAPSNLKTAPSKQEATPSNKKIVPCKKRVAPYQLKYASLKPPPPTKRFKETTEEEIQKLFEARQTNSTKKNTTWGCKMFQDYLRNQFEGTSTIPETATLLYTKRHKHDDDPNTEQPKKKRKRVKKANEESKKISEDRATDQIRYAELIFSDGYGDDIATSCEVVQDNIEPNVEETYEVRYNETSMSNSEVEAGDTSVDMEQERTNALQDFVSNLVTMTPKVNKKRGTYKVYSADLRAKIGKHAAENGVASACRVFGVKESTGRSLKKAYLKAIEMEPSKCILQLPKRDKPIGVAENSTEEKAEEEESENTSQSRLSESVSDSQNDSISETMMESDSIKAEMTTASCDTEEADAKEDAEVPNEDVEAPEGQLDPAILQDFVSNLITMAPKENKREKRGSYKVYSADLRAKIGKHAVDNGVACTARFFDVRESTVRSLKKAYLKALENDPSKDISELPKGDRGRPLVLGKYDEEVLRLVKKIEADGGIVNSWIIMSISKAVLMHRQKSLLAEFGGPIDITKTLAKSILRRFGYSKTRNTKSFPKPLPSNFSELKSSFMSNVSEYVKEYDIPNSLVIFVVETSIPMVPGGNWSLEKEGSRQLTIPGIEDKRQMTIALACPVDGSLMQPQVIYKGKTDACLPKYQFPEGWVVSQSSELPVLANADTAKCFLTNTIIPYIKSKLSEQKPEQRTLLIWDLSNQQKENDDLQDLLNRNNIEVIGIPGNCREHLNPLEVLVNQHYVVLLEKEFQSWYSDIVLERLKGGETDDNMATMVDLRLSLLKPVHASWLVKSHETIVNQSEIISQSIELTGILNTLSAAHTPSFLYKTETEAPSNSTTATPPVKKKPKANIRRPNILQQRHSTQNASVPVTTPVKAPAVVIPASQRQPASNYLPVLQPRAIPAVTQAMPEVARILNSSTFTNIKGFVPVALESGQKRKDASQREEQTDKPKEMDNHMPFRMNIKKLKAGATKSTLMTLRKSLVSKSASLDTAGNTEGDKSNENSTNNPASQNQVSYGEVLKKAMKNSLSDKSSILAEKCDLTQEITPQEYDLSLLQKETSKAAPDWDHNLEPPSELFSKTIKLSETGTDVKTVFQTFTAKKFKKGDKKPKMKPIMLRESSAIQAEEKTESSRPYSFRQRTKKKRFGDDYVEDFKEEPKEEEKEEEEEDSGPIKIEIKREIEEEEVDDDNDEDFKVVDSEEEDEDDETDKVDETEKMQENSSCEEVKNDELEWKYFNENSLEQLFNDHRYSAKKNWKGTFQCTICQTSFRWSVSFIQHLVEKHESLLQDLKLHQCIICDKSFLGIRDLATHYRKVHKQLDCFICRNCNSTFNAAVTYDKHVENCRKRAEGTETNEESSQGEEKKFVCNVCLKPLRTAEGLEKHQQIHKKDSYLMCDVCGIRCTTKQRLSCHKYNRHQNKLGNFSCPHCDRRFMSIWTMYRHNQDIHGCTQVICRECGQYFDTQEQLMTHITNDHPYISHDVSRFSCEDCGKWFDQARYLYVHYKEVHRKQRSVCGFCGKGFESREEFHEHKKTHDLTIPNTCKICAKTCDSPEDLEKHMHYHMRGKTLHQCEVCKEVLIRRQDLVEHMVKHTNKLPFICKECGKGFKNKGKLKVHMISHVSHRPFQCDICGMAFKMKATLSTHIKRHKELKPFKCDYCPLRFKSVEGSRNHMLHKHIKMEDLKNIKFKVYKCEYCNKLMGQKHMYMRHVRLHTGERPCICDECGRSFTMPATLNVHKKTHLARKPHHCDICNFGFIDAHKLGKHYQTLRHKQMVEQKKRVKELAETRARNMQKAVESAKVIDSVNIKLEQVDDMDLYGVPERTQIRLGDEMVVVEKASEDGQQGENREPEAANEVYFSSLISDSVQPDPELMTQVLQGTDLENELLIPKTEIMDE